MSANKRLVVDSSVAIKWLSNQGETNIQCADKILKRVQEKKTTIIMPELAKYEVGNALLYKQMSLQDTLSSLATYYSIPIRFVPQNNKQAQNAITIAKKNNITFYDASFLALAKSKNANLITDNPKHQNKNVTGVKVTSLKDY